MYLAHGMRFRWMLTRAVGRGAVLTGLGVALCGPPVVGQERAWRAVPVRTISSSGDGEQMLTNVRAATWAPDGSVIVALPLDHQLRVYSADGAFLRNLGRRGRGPGEFILPARIGWLGDTLWVSDFAQSDVSFFDSHGTFVRRVAIRYAPTDSLYLPSPAQSMLEDGSALVISASQSSDLAAGRVTRQLLLRVSRANRVIDTISILDVRHASLELTGEGQSGVEYGQQPFSDATLWSVSPHGRRVVTVERDVAARGASQPTTFVVTVWAPTGEPVLRRAYPYRPRRPAPSLVSHVIDSIAERATTGRLPLFSTLERARRGVTRAVVVPPYLPPVNDLLVADDGHVFLRREGAAPAWTVLGPHGDVIASLRAPAGIGLLEMDVDRAIGVRLDENEVPSVVLLRIEHE
jgi:hypothetical protein